MKFYGLGLGVVPTKENPHIFAVSCTPVAVIDKNREFFEVMDGAFETTFELTNFQTVMDCFVDVVDTWEMVVNAQRNSLKGQDYLPVALDIGQDSRNRTSVNTMYMLLFGERFSPPIDGDKLEAQLRESIYPSNYETLSDAEKQPIDKMYSEIRNWYTSSKANSVLAQEIRTNFLNQNQHLTAPFINAHKKLPDLLDACTLQLNSFTLNVDDPKYDIRNLQQTEFDRRLIELKESLDQGDVMAHVKLCLLAKIEGRRYGTETTGTHDFWILAPKGYAQDKEAQERCPSISFVYWHKDYKTAFYKGFDETYKGTHNRRLKLPLDPKCPPFSDPTADAICDVFDVLEGKRAKTDLIDKPELRARIAEDSKRVVASAEPYTSAGRSGNLGTQPEEKKTNRPIE